jgi:hypothetical protein
VLLELERLEFDMETHGFANVPIDLGTFQTSLPERLLGEQQTHRRIGFFSSATIEAIGFQGINCPLLNDEELGFLWATHP